MATVVLQVAGTVIGGALGGPVGAAIGQAAGAAAGYMIDQELFGPGDRVIEGPRLKNSQFLSSEEGTPIARVYGRVRLSGQIIWATRFEEVAETETQGGKGGPRTHVTSYSYFANLAIGLCEGEVACIRRIWADGKLLDQNNVTIRLHKGTQDQLPDSLVEAKQGTGNAPAYRGLAYLVFERLPLEAYGNRIPQIAVEIIRPVGQLEKRIQAMALLPGASEFGYDPLPVHEKIDAQTSKALNSHNLITESDWAASLDELQALCPNLKSVALISSWFGNDLRAGECTCTPKVEQSIRELVKGESWRVSGLERDVATLVSQNNGAPVYGGTPSDGSIIRAIEDCHQRGLKVTFYPFLMMDIPQSNNLPDPYGGVNQATYPWRGRITTYPAIGQPATTNKTAAAGTQISAFVGSAQPGDFSYGENTILYSGANEWSYRRMILHYAKLCALAGGVEAFLIGSELKGLTRIQDETGTFPFVGQLEMLAADVRTILGPATKISYAADWSEYFGYQPDDGSGDVFYNLDSLWADANIDMVAIDNYLPLTDWRDDGAPDGKGTSARDGTVMAENITGGEGFDWYYASAADRENGTRTAIFDGLGKAWIYRPKDFKSWWANAHVPRSGGVEQATSSAWLPQMKPLWFTELGCPAIDKGANQPNVFVDPKSSESHFPYFSSGARDDAVQASFLAAHQRHWDESHPGFDAAKNPASNVYAGRMVDHDNTHLWAWDVRPYPEFPDNQALWRDGENWRLGHWLNGRLGAARLADVIACIMEDYGFVDFDVSNVHGFADGYIISQATSGRNALQSLADLYQVQVLEQGRKLIFQTPSRTPLVQLSDDDFIDNKEKPRISIKRKQETQLPKSVVLEHVDPQLEFQPSVAGSRRIEGGSERQVTLNAPIILPQELAVPLVDNWLRAAWISRDTLQIMLPRRFQHLQIGDHVRFDTRQLSGIWLITRIEEADGLSLDLRSVEVITGTTGYCQPRRLLSTSDSQSGLPLVHLLDLPVLSGNDPQHASRIAISSKPWPGPHSVFSAPDDQAYSFRQFVEFRATIGTLKTPIGVGPLGRWDRASTFDVEILKGNLSSTQSLQLLNGANAAAIRSQNGSWEVLQFANAELVADNTWRLSNLLRGQAGTDDEMEAGAQAGAEFVLLNKAVELLSYEPFETGLPLNWKIAAPDSAISDPGNPGMSFAPGLRGYRPFCPVHLAIDILPGNDAAFSWIRRDRLEADAWNDGDIAMSEGEELYAVKIRSDGTILRQWQSHEPAVLYSRAEQLADIASFPAELVIEVAQISATHGEGGIARMNFTLT